jgi:hypothetical protein
MLETVAPVVLTAPVTPADIAALALTPAQKEAQDIIDKQDYIAMLTSCLPTLKAEHYAGRFLMAEMTKAGDVQVIKKQFLKAAKRVTGGLPPFTEVALQLIANQAKK